MATFNNSRLDNLRRSAGPAFRGQGGYGVVTGSRPPMTAPVPALAGANVAFAAPFTSGDRTHGQEI